MAGILSEGPKQRHRSLAAAVPQLTSDGPADVVEPDPDRFAVLKPEEIPAAFLCAEERNHTTDDRDPFQRWEE